MKNFIFLFFTLMHVHSFSQEFIFQFGGKYQGDNIFIQNPISAAGGKYCTKYILVNKIKIEDSLQASAYEIRLDTLNLKIGDSVLVTIFRYQDCMPTLLNAIPVKHPVYEMQKVSIDETGVLKWTTEKDSENFVYTVQQFLWNKWVKIADIKGIGSNNNFYTYLPLFHSGENKFRIRQSTPEGKSYLSKTVTFTSSKAKLKLKSKYFTDEIFFGEETRYEIYDAYGKFIESGVADGMDASELPKGNYYLYFDNNQFEVIKK